VLVKIQLQDNTSEPDSSSSELESFSSLLPVLATAAFPFAGAVILDALISLVSSSEESLSSSESASELVSSELSSSEGSSELDSSSSSEDSSDSSLAGLDFLFCFYVISRYKSKGFLRLKVLECLLIYCRRPAMQ
jgi:hypothetical protein